MTGQQIGYIRVSTFDQSPERQLEDVDVDRIFSDEALWGADLTRLPGFVDAVVAYLTQMLDDGVEATLRAALNAVHSSTA